MGFKDMRRRAKLTQTKAAAQLGVSRVSVFSWERGEFLPAADKLSRIARLYDCTVDDLLQGNPTFGKASEVRELRARRHESDLV